MPPSYASIDLRQGEVCRINISLVPAQSVVGWTVAFRAIGSKVTFSFPPTTVIPQDLTLWPLTPVWTVQIPGLVVVPGVQPDVPRSGSVVSVSRDNTNDPGGGGITITSSSLGQFQILLPRSITRTLPVDQYWWQFLRSDESDYQVYSEGTIFVAGGGYPTA